MYHKLLIANRGEIACRVGATARRLGIATVAVYSDADAGARHVDLADEAWRLGPAPPAESYLCVERLIEVARASGAQAVHPGYGFLSENADFAEACAAADLVFVGPPPAAIRAMGSKSAAKALMARAGVPLVPGYHGEDQEPERLAREADDLGYPLLLKASAGGGGKGMRVVERSEDFAEALTGARREAQAAFGDDRMLLERYLTRPRHIEIQIFADGRGQVVHLFERDCSLQRRHQKVVEEAPAPGLDSALRQAMGEAAIAAARAIGYEGAGTVEFILEDDAFYFMEMNTRLQVEHPVTEMITGLDLVEWQLRVAAGEPLPFGQEAIQARGHAIEARLYAEDPARGYLPTTGRLAHLRFPESDAALRIDSGVREGDQITPYYDPMIAKLVVWGEDRATALRRLRAGLEATEVAGPTTNLAFLAAIARHPDFASGGVDTGFLSRCEQALTVLPDLDDPAIAALAVAAEAERRRAEVAAQAARSGDPWSPWWSSDGWRLNAESERRLHFTLGEAELVAGLRYGVAGLALEWQGRLLPLQWTLEAKGRLRVDLAGRTHRAAVAWQGETLTLMRAGESLRLQLEDRQAAAAEVVGVATGVVAPMPGKVVQVAVAAGEEVVRGQLLLVLEAMKMEHSLRAPADGRVGALHVRAGDQVEEGVELLAFDPQPAEQSVDGGAVA
ncbi:acetyl/propionyl/methylcrotonyl-CoA carboxylase subunit alpha [Aquibaculum sediminis]|uniref:acetyl/propionyl/methylcrotonyl-CoA carboxylase subunit alpha n=1 Tax=Aquibaculum sediminis TaxID=3231907 RepID=UPI003454C9DC